MRKTSAARRLLMESHTDQQCQPTRGAGISIAPSSIIASREKRSPGIKLRLLTWGVSGTAAVILASLSAAPPAAPTPAPPPACYVNKTSITAIEQRSCVAPGTVLYEQNAHQPTYDGANPMIPSGVNPLVPFGTGQYNNSTAQS